MAKCIRLGILVPSSNTALEPLAQTIISDLPHVSVHFSRFTMTRINLDRGSLSQFQTDVIVNAARLLADARVDIIGWGGNSSGWLGFQADEDLCSKIKTVTGIPATTSVLALNKALQIFGIRNLGLVSPYLHDVQESIIRNYASIGVDISCESHLGLSDNLAIGMIDAATLENSVSTVANGGVEAVTTFCTNFQAAQRVAQWERKYKVAIFDTVSTVIWDMLQSCGVDTRELASKWGQLFEGTCCQR
jgi:maleate isomerase